MVILSRIIVASLICSLAASADTKPGDDFRLERIPVAGGSELLTVFGRLSGNGELPLVSVLRDTLGDTTPDNDRLRYVWVLNFSRPNLIQRAAAGIPFFYYRPVSREKSGKRPPNPVLDLSAATKGVWKDIFDSSLQMLAFDPASTAIRSSTRSYRTNSGDLQKIFQVQGLTLLARLDSSDTDLQVFSQEEMLQLQARLLLAEKKLGNLVADIRLNQAYRKETARRDETRGLNWEILRQRAELSGLYFDPLALAADGPSHALLWIAREDLGKPHRFEGQLLGISDPWKDDRLLRWKGYSQQRWFDTDSRMLPASTQGAESRELIPLALYGLDHPRVPLRLIDFRDTFSPRAREMRDKAMQDMAIGILGLSRFANWYYFAGRAGWDFVSGRFGAAVDRSSRLRSYSQMRQFLSLDDSLDPKLREEMMRRLNHLSTNPMENKLQSEAKLARSQYKALVDYAQKPTGLARRVERDRRLELTATAHGRAAQATFQILSVGSLGLYTHRESGGPLLISEVGRQRKIQFNTMYLQEVVESGPKVEVTWNLENVRSSLRVLAAQGVRPDLIAQLFRHTGDDDLRMECLNALRGMSSLASSAELTRLAADPGVTPSWRGTIADLLRSEPPRSMSGGQ